MNNPITLNVICGIKNASPQKAKKFFYQTSKMFEDRFRHYNSIEILITVSTRYDIGDIEIKCLNPAYIEKSKLEKQSKELINHLKSIIKDNVDKF